MDIEMTSGQVQAPDDREVVFLNGIQRRVVDALRDVGLPDDRSLRIDVDVGMGVCVVTASLRDHLGTSLQVKTTRDPLIPSDDLLRISVDYLGMSPRVVKLLKEHRVGDDLRPISTLGDLVRRRDSELLLGRRFGRVALREVVEALAARNLSLGMQVVDGHLRDVQLRLDLRGSRVSS